LKRASKSSLFFWRRDPVLELQFLMLLRVVLLRLVLLRFATQALQWNGCVKVP